MTLIETEAWSERPAQLSHDQAAELASLGLVDVVAQPQSDDWLVVSDSRIGVASGSGWEVRVRPKLAVPKLFFLLAYAADPKGWRDSPADFGLDPDLLDVVASGFSWHALNAVDRGLLRGYVRVDERLLTIRGRIRFGDQIARSASLPLPVELSYDEYTEDIIENQIVKTATLALLRLHRVPIAARKRLLRLRGLLEGVSVLHRPREVTKPPITRLNERYRPALGLGELVLKASSIDASRDLEHRAAATAFVFDMNRVFEDFVSTALSESMERFGGRVEKQWSGSLDVDGGLRIRPDITWWRGETCSAVADSKYKALELKGMPNADAYQMLAYCTALGLTRGFLVYARDSGQRPRSYAARNSDCVIEVRTLDVESQPEKLLDQVDVLADEIADTTAVASAA